MALIMKYIDSMHRYMESHGGKSLYWVRQLSVFIIGQQSESCVSETGSQIECRQILIKQPVSDRYEGFSTAPVDLIGSYDLPTLESRNEK